MKRLMLLIIVILILIPMVSVTGHADDLLSINGDAVTRVLTYTAYCGVAADGYGSVSATYYWYVSTYNGQKYISSASLTYVNLSGGARASLSKGSKKVTVKIIAVAGAHPTTVAKKTCRP